MRIAMWSGPRNLSTAMMYAFGNRQDMQISDEPFYAAFLAASGLDHPMRDAILAAHETDPQRVADECAIDGQPHRYMKHMPHHMLPGFPMDWAKGCVNVHLIRHPARVIASYTAKRDAPTLDDIGYARQLEVFDEVGGIVMDGTDIRAAPEAMLRHLCAAIDLPFDPAMLSWPAGPRRADGIWASHWYNSVHRSTQFALPEGALPDLPRDLWPLLDAAMPLYEGLFARRVSP